MPVRLEPVSEEHLEGLCRAIEAVARERRYLGNVDGFPLEEVRQFTAGLAAAGGVQLVAVDDDGSVAGWCDIRRNPFDGFRHVGTLGVGLLPAHRERGLGPKLLARTIEAAAAAGMHRIELEVFASNTRAVHVFEKAGFVREGLKRGARLLDGVADDLVCMALLLPRAKHGPPSRRPATPPTARQTGTDRG